MYVWNNCIIFQHNLNCVQCIFSSVSSALLRPGFLWEKIFWLLVSAFVHCLLDFFVRSESGSTKRLFKWSIDVVILRGEVCRVGWMRKTLKMHVLDLCSCSTGSMGPSIVMLQQNTRSESTTTFSSDCWFQMIFKDVAV